MGGSTAEPGAVDTWVEAREKPADTVMAGERDDDNNTGRELVPRTSSVRSRGVTVTRVVLCDKKCGGSFFTMLQIIWRKSAIERSETWRSAIELAASGGDGLAAWSVASGRLATTWLSAGGGGGQVRCCLVLLTTTTHYTTSARTATTGANTASSSGHGNGS